MSNNSSRNAAPSIIGYCYQFLHSIKDILENKNDDYINTIEGIEDLDIDKLNEKDVIQYKYHTNKKYTPNQVAKPIALMFNYFINNQKQPINYKLFIHLTDLDLPELNSKKLCYILNLDTAKNCINNSNIYLASSSDIVIVNQFKEKFSWKLTPQYNDLEAEVIDMITAAMNTSSEESKYLYFVNAIEIIQNLAREADSAKRKITKKSFIDKLNNCGNKFISSYILRTHNFKKLKALVCKQMKTWNIQKHTSDYTIIIKNMNMVDINALIVELAKKFCHTGNKLEYRPITFILDCNDDRYKDCKKSILEYIVKIGDLIKINDGYADYAFNIDVFNDQLIHITTKDKKKYIQVNFNFKLIPKHIYDLNKKNIKFNNQSIFILDSNTTINEEQKIKQFYLNNLSNEQIIEIIGAD